MYSLVFSMRKRPELRRVDEAHRYVMGSLAAAIGERLPDVSVQGTCDLTWRNRKFSGNSVRIAREHLLYHGTLLYAADLQGIARALTMPPRRPEYRQDREHGAFLTNVPLPRSALEEAVAEAFDAVHVTEEVPLERASQLVRERYSRAEWNQRH